MTEKTRRQRAHKKNYNNKNKYVYRNKTKIRKQYRLIFFNFIIKSKEKHSQLFYIVILKLYTIIYKMYHINCKYICTKEIINISLFKEIISTLYFLGAFI